MLLREFIRELLPIELNAILNCKGKDLTGCRIYVGLFPCNECAKAIIQSGIKEVYLRKDENSPVLKVSVDELRKELEEQPQFVWGGKWKLYW